MTALSSVLGALAAPRRAPARVVSIRPEPWEVATYLAEALHGTPAADRIGAATRELVRALPDRPAAAYACAMDTAVTLRDRVMACAPEDRVPTMLALLRALLDDAPTDAAVTLDRTIVDAMRAEGVVPDARQTTMAARIAAEVMGR